MMIPGVSWPVIKKLLFLISSLLLLANASKSGWKLSEFVPKPWYNDIDTSVVLVLLLVLLLVIVFLM